jgi:hypothetical protein
MSDSAEQTTSERSGGCGTGGQCLCAGAGPAVTGAVSHMMRQYGPSEPVRRHFSQARLEILKGLRALLDQRIEEIQKPPSRGSKVTVD